ncbi:MAG: hypothetical protein BWY15_01318 [Firmicutes bacterium ADurb.Bin193]|nr:MAG: hypothetical protein BWY15_01318 [Firmicutes bacterium ADurb.Bin193]
MRKTLKTTWADLSYRDVQNQLAAQQSNNSFRKKKLINDFIEQIIKK